VHTASLRRTPTVGRIAARRPLILEGYDYTRLHRVLGSPSTEPDFWGMERTVGIRAGPISLVSGTPRFTKPWSLNHLNDWSCRVSESASQSEEQHCSKGIRRADGSASSIPSEKVRGVNLV